MCLRRIALMVSFTVVVSCNKAPDQNAINKKAIQKNVTNTSSWQEALINTACGPDDGIMNQIRFGWSLDKTNHQLLANYPFLIIDYREAQDKSIQIFNAEYCSKPQQCEYSTAEAQTLIINSSDTSDRITGSYVIRLVSGKLLSGKFTAPITIGADSSDKTAMSCG
jgi:hypothetical protein